MPRKPAAKISRLFPPAPLSFLLRCKQGRTSIRVAPGRLLTLQHGSAADAIVGPRDNDEVSGMVCHPQPSILAYYCVVAQGGREFFDRGGWLSVQEYAEVNVDEVRLVLCHYPFRSWRDMPRSSINLHGHSHGRLKPMPRQFDVGVDARGFRPVTLEELLGAQARRAKSDQ